MNQFDSFLSLRKGNKSTIFWFWLTSFAPFLFIYLHIFAILWTCEENVSVWLISNLLICCFHFYSSPNGTGSFCWQFCFMCVAFKQIKLDTNSNFDSSQFWFTPYKEILNHNWKISLVLSGRERGESHLADMIGAW